MKIKTKITQETDTDITLPFFRKDGSYLSNKYMAVLDDKTQVTIFHNELRTHVSIDVPDPKDGDIYKAYSEWNEVSEEEFLVFHEKILKSLSLTPQLSEVDKEIEEELSRKNVDDIKNVL